MYRYEGERERAHEAQPVLIFSSMVFGSNTATAHYLLIRRCYNFFEALLLLYFDVSTATATKSRDSNHVELLNLKIKSSCSSSASSNKSNLGKICAPYELSSKFLQHRNL